MSVVEPFDWGAIMAPDAACAPLVRCGLSSADIAHVGAGLICVAAPYTREVLTGGTWDLQKSMRASMLAAREVYALARHGVTAICPALHRAEVLHSAGVVAGPKLDPLDQVFWAGQAQRMLNPCSVVVVPDIAGWRRSTGVRRAVGWALDHNIPVVFYAASAA